MNRILPWLMAVSIGAVLGQMTAYALGLTDKTEAATRIRVTFNKPPANISGHVCVFADGAMECVDIETYMKYAAKKHVEVSE